MKNVSKAFGFLLIFFPFIIYYLEKADIPPYFKYIFLVFALVFAVKKNESNLWIVVSVSLLSLLSVLIVNGENIVRVYPFVMSASALSFFIITQKKDSSALIYFSSRFVKIDEKKREYLKNAGYFWICGLALNTLIFFVLLFFFSFKVWLIYSGVISYIFLGSLFLLTLLGGFIHERR